jgi:hypothetical protein
VDGPGGRRRTRKSLAPRRPPNSDSGDSREQAQGSGADAHDTAVVAGERQVGKTEDNSRGGGREHQADVGSRWAKASADPTGEQWAPHRARPADVQNVGMPANGGVSGVIDAVMDETGSSRGREARKRARGSSRVTARYLCALVCRWPDSRPTLDGSARDFGSPVRLRPQRASAKALFAKKLWQR